MRWSSDPHSFLLGYEIMVRMIGHGWMNVILTTNAVLAGLEQSKALPSGNAIFGAGWTPRVGSFVVPAHAFFIPDVDGNHSHEANEQPLSSVEYFSDWPAAHCGSATGGHPPGLQ